MLALLESTWPVWWILAILVLLRWFHINSLSHDYSEGNSGLQPCRLPREPQAHSVATHIDPLAEMPGIGNILTRLSKSAISNR